jgi:hypothetical protein
MRRWRPSARSRKHWNAWNARGRWTFQIVEDFDDNYWSVFRDHERRVREELQHGHRHVFEAQMKERRRTHGKPGHESRP